MMKLLKGAVCGQWLIYLEPNHQLLEFHFVKRVEYSGTSSTTHHLVLVN